MKWRILSDGWDGAYPLHGWYAHPWEAEQEMLKYGITGWVQGFRDGMNRTYLKDWYRVDF